jgi:hypothetical protein
VNWSYDPNLSDTKLFRNWNFSDTELTRHRNDPKQNLSYTELIRYQIFQILIFSNSELTRYRTDLIPNWSDTVLGTRIIRFRSYLLGGNSWALPKLCQWRCWVIHELDWRSGDTMQHLWALTQRCRQRSKRRISRHRFWNYFSVWICGPREDVWWKRILKISKD